MVVEEGGSVVELPFSSNGVLSCVGIGLRERGVLGAFCTACGLHRRDTHPFVLRQTDREETLIEI